VASAALMGPPRVFAGGLEPSRDRSSSVPSATTAATAARSAIRDAVGVRRDADSVSSDASRLDGRSARGAWWRSWLRVVSAASTGRGGGSYAARVAALVARTPLSTFVVGPAPSCVNGRTSSSIVSCGAYDAEDICSSPRARWVAPLPSRLARSAPANSAALEKRPAGLRSSARWKNASRASGRSGCTLVGGRDWAFANAQQDVGSLVSRERVAASEATVRDHGERPEIAARVDIAPASRLFGAHEVR